jgi:hemoglobin
VQEETIYSQLGAERLRAVVDAFYRLVSQHPDLAPIFPADLRLTAEKQYLFLTQFFGGPALYSEAFGHPMLRARHLPFPVTPARASAWLDCMERAMEEAAVPAELRQAMLTRLVPTARHMINSREGS